jgi:Ca-activated chloride channel family protein
MSDVHFAHPLALLALLLLPVLFALRGVPALRRKKEGSFLFSRAGVLAAQGRTWRTFLMPLPDLLLVVAVGLTIIGLARPQTIIAEEVEVEGIDIYLVLDMSGSMHAIDLDRPEIRRRERAGQKISNRFEDAVATLKDFVAGRQYDRIGMVVFAKEAYLQFPLTLDYSTILNMLDQLRLGDIDKGGTAIGNALGRALAGMKDSETKTRIVIFITDGDRRGGNISPKQAAEMAKKLGIKVFPILVGRDEKTLVPVGRDFISGDVSYQEMEFPINEPLLKEMAQITGGSYFRAADAQALREGLHKILDEFERTRLRDATNVEHRELYYPFIRWALLLLALQLLLRATILRKFP